MYTYKAISLTSCFVCVCLLLSSCENLEPRHVSKISLQPIGIPQAGTQSAPVINGLKNRHPSNVANHTKSELYPGSNRIVSGSGVLNQTNQSVSKGTYMLNFDDADVGEVAKTILSDSLGLNYVLSPKVSGKVTLQTTEPLSREELLPTLEMLLKMNNAALIKDGKIYHIEPTADALYGSDLSSGNSKAGYQTRVIAIKNVAAKDIADLLKPMVREKTILNVDADRNLLVVSGNSEEIERVMDMVNTFDIDLLKGRSFGLFTLAHVEPENMIDELEAVFDTRSDDKDAGFFRFIPIDRLNAVLAITQQAHYLNDIEKWVIRLDKASTQDGGGGGVNVYRVQHVDAVELADTLNEIFGNGTGTKKEKPAKVAPGQNATEMNNKQASTPATPKKTSKSSSGTKTGDASVSNIGNVRIIADDPNNSLIIVSTPQEYQVIRPIIAQLDVMPLQVLIDATIVEVDLVDDLKYGLQWSFESGNFHNILSKDSFTSLGGIASATAAGYSLFYSGGSAKAVLSALATKSLLNVIASPSIMVLNNQEASINVGDKVPIATSQATNTNSLNSTPLTSNNAVIANNIQMVETGVILKLTPRVNAGGLVIMNIDQQFNKAVQTDTSQLNSPTIRQRKINSSIAVKSGETIVLGGLIRDDYLDNIGGMPFLSTLPIIGPLFGLTERSKTKTELVMLITPRVVESSKIAKEVTDEFKHKLTGIYEEYHRH